MREMAIIVLALIADSASAFAQPYPADDWVLYKPNTNDDALAKDYAACLMSPTAPAILDQQGRATKNPTLLLAHKRFVLSCMGAKGYVLKPPTAKR
jgi:hypothetical protein